MDSRIDWLQTVLIKYLHKVTHHSFQEFLQSNEKNIETIVNFFDSDLTKNGILIFTATEGDFFEIVERSTNANYSRKTRQQRIELKTTYVPNSIIAGSNVTGKIHCVFLSKTTALPIKEEDIVELKKMNKTLNSIEIVATEVPSLLSLHAILLHAFLPFLEDSSTHIGAHSYSTRKDALSSEVEDNGIISSISGKKQFYTEVVSWVRRLNQHINGFINQVCAERKLPMPAKHLALGDIETDIRAAASNPDIVKEVDAIVSLWNDEISSALSQEIWKEGPIGEIEYWKEKYSAFSALYEQINSSKVKNILKIAAEAECCSWSTISSTIAMLVRQYAEAKDNVKFLSTLDRHFRTIDGVVPGISSLQPIIDTMGSMMMAIRMVWIISRYFNTEEKMIGLLEKIAIQISQKVSQHIDFRTILSLPTVTAIKKIREGHQVLIRWKSAYTAVQEEINQSEKEQHWVFDHKRLFDATDYMADRCVNLMEIVNIIEYYNTVLGSQLKSVLTDSSGIEKILKDVEKLKKSMESLPFDPFERKSMHNWQAAFSNFNSSVSTLDQNISHFIQRVFDDELRSAESAFALLQSFKNMQTRIGGELLDMNQLMAAKTDKILHQYSIEVDRVKKIFEQNCNNPPLTKNQPSIAGSIHWSSSLYQRLKKPILRFQEEDLLYSNYGKKVKAEYVEVARMLKEYATSRYEKWRSDVRNNTSTYLKAKILKKINEDVFIVNFSENLFLIIKEAKYLDRLGFDIPPEPLNVTLQDEAFHNHVNNLKSMLQSLNNELALIEPPEKNILFKQIQEIKDVLKPGYTELNWVCLGIPEFILNCNKAIVQFSNLSREIRKNAKHIQTQLIDKIASCQLLPDHNEIVYTGAFPELHNVIESVETIRRERIEKCLREYSSISPLLVKMETQLTNAGTGKCPLLEEYYAMWEHKIWKSLLKLVVNSLSRLASLLGHQRSDYRGKSKQPLFKVVFHFTNEPIFSPSQQEIMNSILKISQSIIDTTKLFVRWMRGTCIEYTAGRLTIRPSEESNEPLFSFFSDIENSQQVRILQERIRKIVQSCVSDLEAKRRVLREDRYCSLYVSEKKQKVDAQLKDQLHWLDYDSKFQSHYDEIAEFDTEHISKIGFVLCDETPCFNALIENLNEWIKLDGDQLSSIAMTRVNSRQQKINKFAQDLQQEPTGIESLKFILETMDNVLNANLEMEMDYREIEFIYDSMLRYKLPIPEEELSKVRNLRISWNEVLSSIKKVDVILAPKKKEYRDQTQDEVLVFQRLSRSLLDEFRRNGPSRSNIDLNEGLELKNKWRDQVRDLMIKREQLAKAEKLFNLPLTTFDNLQELNKELTAVEVVYKLYEQWIENLKRWNRTNWKDLNIEDLQKVTDEKVKQARILSKTHGKVEPFLDIQKMLLNFHSSLPLLTKLKSPALKVRHWNQLMKVTGKEFNLDKITLDDLVNMEVYRFSEEIDQIVLIASRELGVEKEIQSIKNFWAAKEFVPVKYAPRKNEVRCYVLSDTSEIQEAVDDNILKIQSLANVKWVQPFIDDVRIWEKKLATINDVISVWVQIQVKWQYLESIFKGSEDIVNQLPKEAAKFNDLDKKWIRIMNDTVSAPNVDLCCNVPDRLIELKYIDEKLDECQKDLANYLEGKRCIFPRFYFISDDELLSILASVGARSVQDHMLKMFDNCAQLVLKGNTEIIEGVESCEKENLNFDNELNVEGQLVENWLNSVLSEKKSTLHNILKAAVFYYPKMDRLEWIKKYHGMINLCGCKIWWTYQVEDAFAKIKKGVKGAVKELSSKLSLQLTELVGEMDKDIDKQYRKKINTLIIVDVHGRDIVDRFVRDSVMDAREFDWESQLRFYWEKQPDTCQLRQCTGIFDYGYEYMGLNGRLVITPLTDRCFMTLTQALTFYLGGAPGGPAGTGKTESVKDLAKAMAVQCVVFNCGEGLDYKAMWSIFSGLSQAGSWGCFDEFNRIELPVLSVVSEQLRSIQSALKNSQESFLFGDKEIKIVSTVGVFITMNPGYSGRVELPDNLKALFRPVVMAVPDMELIAENMLFSEGFKMARELAKKMVTLYSLAKGQLSKQHHYDWGLRALKAVLVMAGQLKRGAPNLPEKSVLMRALRDMNAPKFIAEDEPLFKGLIGDLFPGLDPTRVPQENLAKAATKVVREAGYKVDAKQIDKVVQLYETMQTRHTTMVVGPSGGGKSVVINTLRRAQNELKLPTKLFIINPKAQPTTVLYGILDPMTRNWTDGIFSSIFRQMNKIADGERERRYVVFDGDVDAKWVEDMNSVMDDNKLLTLPNGERIRLHPNCSLLFEVGDLQYASPATVSRVGMVYLDAVNLGWLPFAHSWKQRRHKDEIECLNEFFDQYIQYLINFVLEGVDEENVVPPPKLVIPTTNLNMVRQLCTMLQTIISSKTEIPEPKSYQSIFIFCCIWSFGALICKEEDRCRFDIFLKKICNWPLQDCGENFLTRFVGAGALPEKKTLYDYFFDVEDNRWKPWHVLTKPFSRPIDGKFSSILVSTPDTERSMWLLNKIVNNRTPVLFVGESGTAKTVTIQAYLRNLKNKPAQGDDDVSLEAMFLEMNFSSRTTSLDAQRTLEDNIEKRTNLILGPPAKKRLLVFIDDINMPKVDLYGTQQPIAFLKLLLEHSSWYDRKDLLFKNVRDTQFIAAMAPPGGGRNALDSRFTSLFSIFNIIFPNEESLNTIYLQILDDFYSNVSQEIAEITPQVTAMTLEFYKEVVTAMPATPAKFHYIFNLRDLSRIYEGLCRITIDKFPVVDSVIRLWRNEVMRVFGDRMADQDDKTFVSHLIEAKIRKNFPASAEIALSDPLLFGDFGDFEPDSEKERLHLYEDLGTDYATVRSLVDEILAEINTPTTKLDLVMFDSALEHLLRIVRVISIDRGHCLLVGVGGSGKQSLSKLAAAICQISIFEIVLTRNYDELQFREDLKKLFFRVGVDRQKQVFLFTDNNVKQESFLELINNLLASGMVPAMYTEEEKEPLYQSVLEELDALNLAPSKDNKWTLFVNRCRDNLHVILSMSPSGDVLRTRCRNFPSLINNTTIDWFNKWPAQALKAVAIKLLANENLPDDLRSSITEIAVYVHTTADDLSIKYFQELKRHNYVTPKNFISFLANYSRLLAEKRDEIDDIVEKYKTGLERLQKASEDVAVLGKELAEKEIDLLNKTQLNEAMMKEIMASKAQNEARTAEVVQLEEELNVKGRDIEIESAEAKKILDEALPEFNRAAEAVSKISKDDINELKAFANPQATIKAVVQMVCIFNDENPTWEQGKIMMNNPQQFVATLKSQELRDKLDQKKMNEVAKIKKQFPDINWLEKLSTASKAAFGLMTWVEALTNYYQVARLVKPKEARVAQLLADQHAAEVSLQRCRDEIERLFENQRALEEQYAAGQAEAKKLEQEATIMKRRLTAAKRLINGFTSERERWQQEITELGNARSCLVGDCLASSAFISYLGAFTFYFRQHAFEELWLPDIINKAIPVTQGFKLRQLLTNEVETSQWASDGLPGDDLSIQNGILTMISTSKRGKGKKAGKVRFPLCIDPQMQAVKWIKRQHLDNSRFEIASFSDPDFLKRLEFCIQYGNPFLFENVDEFIDPIIDTVLDPVFKDEGGQKMIRLGDKEIVMDENFKLYLCTKISNPNYPAEVFGKTLVINYGVTEDGLESQLLNYVVASERSDLQKQSEELVQTMAENRAQLKQLEDSLIRELTLATGNILDNDELISTLESTKSSASEVKEKLAQANETAHNTDLSRQEYRPAAKRGATLYFVISQLSAINSMYEYSLGSFLTDVFGYSIAKSEPSFEISTRLINIINSLTYNLYCYVCMGIFERHKLMFSFQIACRLLSSHNKMIKEELDFFLRGCLLASKDFPPNSFNWLSERQWNDICMISRSVDVFKNLVEDVQKSPEEWRQWIGLDRPEDLDSVIPGGYREKMTPFQRLCLLRCFRPDRVYIAVAQFISGCEFLGDKFTVPPILKYKDVFIKSSCMSPIVCIVSPGANPTDEIIKLAEKEVGISKLRSISLGQGQGEEAMKMVELGAVRGHWVLLQNCHLLITWMKDLEKVVEKRDQNPPHLEFRLWLTTEPSPDFPLGVLQRSLKVVNEPPNGLKMNMKNTLSKVSEEQLEKCSHPAFRPLVYTLSFFHAVVQERRKYGKIGWNVIYDFNETDFTISMRLLNTYLTKAFNNNDPLPWDTLRYLVGEAMYGGRVTDEFDRRIVRTYLEEYFGDFLFDTFRPFHFFCNNKLDYALPPGSNDSSKKVTLAAMVAYVDEMPLENQPDVFGLHPNAETGYLKDAAELMWVNLIELMPRTNSEGGSSESREALLQTLTEDILSQIPKPFDRKQIMKNEKEKAKAAKHDNLEPVQVVLLQEIERWNNLVNTIVISLQNLQRALSGIIGMSADLEELASSLNNGQLPALWRYYAPATRKNLGRWLAHFQKRYEQYQLWIKEDAPKVMWLSGLMIPDSYISALVQITCRKYVWPLDRSTIFTTVTKYATPGEVKERPKDGAYVSGIYIEGARWDNKKMCLAPQIKKILIYEMPVMHIIPTETSKLKRVGTFRTPVYVTRDRRNAAGVGLVFEADLATEDHFSHWILESVALCLNSDD